MLVNSWRARRVRRAEGPPPGAWRESPFGTDALRRVRGLRARHYVRQRRSAPTRRREREQHMRPGPARRRANQRRASGRLAPPGYTISNSGAAAGPHRSPREAEIDGRDRSTRAHRAAVQPHEDARQRPIADLTSYPQPPSAARPVRGRALREATLAPVAHWPHRRSRQPGRCRRWPGPRLRRPIGVVAVMEESAHAARRCNQYDEGNLQGIEMRRREVRSFFRILGTADAALSLRRTAAPHVRLQPKRAKAEPASPKRRGGAARARRRVV